LRFQFLINIKTFISILSLNKYSCVEIVNIVLVYINLKGTWRTFHLWNSKKKTYDVNATGI